MSTLADRTSQSDDASGPDRRTTRLERLVELSADGYDAYEDVDWSVEVDPEDPRLALFDFDPLARTAWYQRLPEERRAEVGLARIASNLRIGWEFENLLQQGLLNHAWSMRNTNASFRYLHTEIMEESQHTLMFYEFVRRHAAHARGMGGPLRTLADPFVYVTARRTPALFYFMVLGGEIPIDHVQRLAIKSDRIHPLVHQIMSYHVEEEARHVAFANEEIRRTVPELSTPARHALAMAIPAVLAIMAPLMINPSPWLVRHYAIPKGDLSRALAHPESRQLLADSCSRIQRVVESADLMTAPAERAWKAAGIWSAPRSRS